MMSHYPTILVTGANGQLGSELREISGKYPYRFLFTDVQELDLTDGPSLIDYFRKNPIDYCINCAAYTAVDKAETDRETAWKLNVTAVDYLANACQRHATTLFHISTDFVFDGDIASPKTEWDQTQPVNYYGETKLRGELTALNNCRKTIIIRTSWLYSSFGNNFVKTMIRISGEKHNLNVVYDQVGTPTYARNLSEVLLRIIFLIHNEPEKYRDCYGIYHYSNEGIASWYDLACAVVQLKKIPATVFPIRTFQFPTPAKRPAFSVLDKSKMKKTFSLHIPYWRDSLSECLQLL